MSDLPSPSEARKALAEKLSYHFGDIESSDGWDILEAADQYTLSAVKEERERAAKIVEDAKMDTFAGNFLFDQVADEIRRREGGTT